VGIDGLREWRYNTVLMVIGLIRYIWFNGSHIIAIPIGRLKGLALKSESAKNRASTPGQHPFTIGHCSKFRVTTPVIFTIYSGSRIHRVSFQVF
jgi:hypothetical protein